MDKLVKYDGTREIDLHANLSLVTDDTEIDTHSSALFQEKAIGAISNHVAWYNTSKPLFLYYAMQSVHAPLESPGVDSYTTACAGIVNENRQIYCEMTMAMDAAIGAIFDAIESNGIANNTVVLVTSDNGGNPKYSGFNNPLRGTKTTNFEGGVRSSSFLWASNSSGIIPQEQLGTSWSGLMHITDWLPTFLSLSERTPTADTIDGINMWDNITSNSSSPRSELLHNLDEFGDWAIRVGDYKLINSSIWTTVTLGGVVEPPTTADDPSYSNPSNTGKLYLFNIADDPYEQTDLVDSDQVKTNELLAILDTYRSLAVAQFGTENDDDAKTKAEEENGWMPWQGDEPADTSDDSDTDNKKYILIGVAGVVAIGITVCAYCALCRGKKSENGPTTANQQQPSPQNQMAYEMPPQNAVEARNSPII